MKLARYQFPEVMGWPGFGQLNNLQQEINRLFYPGAQHSPAGIPALDVYENAENLLVEVELPGLNRDAIDISLEQGELTISGELRKATEGTRFTRTISLPKAVDANRVSAQYRDGILVITLAKAAEAKPRRINVQIN